MNRECTTYHYSLKTDSKNYEFIPLSTTQHKKNKEPKKLLIHPSKDYPGKCMMHHPKICNNG